MRKKYFLVILIVIVLICICVCTIIIKKIKIDNKNILNDLDFKEKQSYLINNKESLDYVTARFTTNGDRVLYKIDNDTAISTFCYVQKITLSNFSVTDNYYSYNFYFKNGDVVKFNFEGNYYVEGQNTYNLLEFHHISHNEEDVLPYE